MVTQKKEPEKEDEGLKDVPKEERPIDSSKIEDIPQGMDKFKPEDDDSGYNIQVIADNDAHIDPFVISKRSPEYEYRFLKDDYKNLSTKTSNLLLQKGGWQICGRKHLEELGIQERYYNKDGMYRVGDTILAYMPKEFFKKKEEHKKKLADAPVNAVQRVLNQGDPNTGGKAMHESMKGIQTQEQLGM